MNWAGNQKGEGIEYFLLLFGLSIILLLTGGGTANVDFAIWKLFDKNRYFEVCSILI
jgi:putative oxidoreductase